MHKDIKEILFSEDTIAKRIEQLGKQISEEYRGEQVVFVGIMKGSVMFLADLVRSTDADCILDFATVQSYRNGTTSGELTLMQDISTDIEGKNVIIVEDILDTGKTLSFLCDYFSAKKPKSLKICTLLDKKVKKECYVKADYVGFEVDNLFVVGYGLDYAQKYRALPYIGILKESAK